MTDFVRVEIEFEALESKRFRMYSGAYVRGFVYWVLGRMDRAFAERLHSSRGISPFSVTPVMLNDYPVSSLEEGKEYRFSITFFVPEIGEALRDYLISANSVYFTAVENPLRRVRVRYVDMGSLEEGPTTKFRVDFVSPCYFRMPSNSYRFVPMPMPELMFRSLARLYSAFIEEVPADYRRWLDEGGIAVSGLKIETEKVLLKKSKWAAGFTGWVNFSMPDDLYSEQHARLTAKLLRFGEYSNVGGGRTSGLGVMRCKIVE
ncbi:CRISPR-associated endoribonuclease Cas6 [Geoglobus acetivorans]|uniref:CRISPR-associated endoribonuclease Cas6 n=1 Tax=Geoglobus acetivorans TaxID=565033 RepID=A0ABZ3H185_GEOAI|nr:CRISPR-associated endoribonuclease Cas6 [Geoglobus acetivorans]